MDDVLLYIVFGLYCAAVPLYFIFGRKCCAITYSAGAALNVLLVINRWIEAGHLPFSNMYETLMTLGACIYFLHLITEYGLKVNALWLDPLIAAIVITPVAFVFDKEIRPLMPALQSPLFFPHVFSYIMSYAAMAKACALAGYTLASQERERNSREKSAYQVICVGFPLLTAGLLLGAVWGKLAWGDYWSWDPKEMWSLVTWMTYLGYFHLRYRNGPRHPWVPWLAILGFVMVLITLFWVNLSKIFPGLHNYAS